jgi:hypothetical protein
MANGTTMNKIAHMNEIRASRVRDIESLLGALQRERADLVRLMISQMGPDGELYSHSGRLIASYKQDGDKKVFRLA